VEDNQDPVADRGRVVDAGIGPDGRAMFAIDPPPPPATPPIPSAQGTTPPITFTLPSPLPPLDSKKDPPPGGIPSKNEIRIIPIYQPRPHQIFLHRKIDEKRFGVIICHRRFGKTVAGINHLIMHALQCSLDRPRVAYICPFLKQAKANAWDMAQDYSKGMNAKVNQSELRIDYPNGGRLRLYGADYPDSLKGIYLDMVILDEFDDMSPRVFTEVLRPLLADRKGCCYMFGTPKGQGNLYTFSKKEEVDSNWFCKIFRQSETGILDANEVAQMKLEMSEDEYNQEMECSFTSSVVGAYWSKELSEARSQGRVTKVVPDLSLAVDTFWDLGIGAGNAMAIWFGQKVGREMHWLDYYEMEGAGFPHYVKVLSNRGYKYGMHYAPHDIAVRELGTGKSRLEIAAELGLNFRPVPRVSDKSDSIEAARGLIGISWFDGIKCSVGLEHLSQYRREWVESGRVWKATPLHNADSNGADSFQCAAMVTKVEGLGKVLGLGSGSRWGSDTF